MAYLLIAIVSLPLAAAIATACIGWANRGRNVEWLSWITIGAFAASFVASVFLFVAFRGYSAEARQSQVRGIEYVAHLWTWAATPLAHDQEPAQPEPAAPWTQTSASARSFSVDVSLRADSLTIAMLMMVTFVSTLVAIFASSYMHGDSGYWRFFSYVGLFVFSMTMLVSVSNFLLLFVFWELVGACSYLLIGFWFTKPEAASAGMKAFLVNRVGDFGFALAVFLIWTSFGTLNYHDTLVEPETGASQYVDFEETLDGKDVDSLAFQPGVLGKSRNGIAYAGGGLGVAICLLLLVGACGKSAQFPLHVWLPDAMEGPTPVSALIHAATMVTAGVYLVARCTPLFMAAPDAQAAVAVIGGLTALMAGVIAVTQTDLKRVLAYSTVSQLGYMFMGLGAGTFAGITAGMFHLITHAFFKALLFLGSGSVMHAMGNVIDMRRFGGLKEKMPITHWTFLVGSLALAGVAPLSGFWSKDAVIAAVHERSHVEHHGGGHDEAPLIEVSTNGAWVEDAAVAPQWRAARERWAAVYLWVYRGALLTGFLTALYTFRAYFMTFHGPVRVPPEAAGHDHESPPMMWQPLVTLAVLAAIAGLWFDRTYFESGPTHYFGEFIASSPSLSGVMVGATRHGYEFHWDEALLNTCIALGGAGLAAYLFLGDSTAADFFGNLFQFEWPSKLGDVESAARLRNSEWVQIFRRDAERLYLGWLANWIGSALLLLLLVVTAPLGLLRMISPYRLSHNKFYLDEIYQVAIVTPVKFVARAAFAFDRWMLDGLVDWLGQLPKTVGRLMRALHMGLVQFYALVTVLAIAVLILIRMLWI